MTRPPRLISVAANVSAIREFGQGEGHVAPRGRKPLPNAMRAERAFRRYFKGIVGNPR